MITVMDHTGTTHNYESEDDAMEDFDFHCLLQLWTNSNFFYPEVIRKGEHRYQGFALNNMIVYVPFAQGEANPPSMITYFIKGAPGDE